MRRRTKCTLTSACVRCALCSRVQHRRAIAGSEREREKRKIRTKREMNVSWRSFLFQLLNKLWKREKHCFFFFFFFWIKFECIWSAEMVLSAFEWRVFHFACISFRSIICFYSNGTNRFEMKSFINWNSLESTTMHCTALINSNHNRRKKCDNKPIQSNPIQSKHEFQWNLSSLVRSAHFHLMNIWWISNRSSNYNSFRHNLSIKLVEK